MMGDREMSRSIFCYQVDILTPVTVQTPSVRQPSPIVERNIPEATEPPDVGEMNENLTPAPDATVTSELVVGLRRSGRVRRGNSKYSEDLYDLSQ